MATSQAATINVRQNEISTLIEQFVAEHPLGGTALNDAALHYVAGRLMLLLAARQTTLTSSEACGKFAACLFILIVQESLLNRRPTIFGFDAGEIHDYLIEHARHVEPSALLRQVQLLDQDGASFAMAQQPGCMECLYTSEGMTMLLSRVNEADDATEITTESSEGDDAKTEQGGMEAAAASAIITSNPAFSKLTRRMQLILCAIAAATIGYAATWNFQVAERPDRAATAIAAALGEHANNLTQLLYFLALISFLAMMFPDELDSPEARKYIGPLLAVSNVCDTCVAVTVARVYADTRSEGARTDANQRTCLYIHYAVVAFFVCWGVIYPTIVFFFLRNSWCRLRVGLTVDAAVFLTAIGALWYFGETRYPPGDAPLSVALYGRPAICLFGAIVYTPATRRRIAACGAALGFFHVKMSLNELPTDEIRRILGTSGYGVPVASGNVVEASHACPLDAAGSLFAPQSEPAPSKPEGACSSLERGAHGCGAHGCGAHEPEGAVGIAEAIELIPPAQSDDFGLSKVRRRIFSQMPRRRKVGDSIHSIDNSEYSHESTSAGGQSISAGSLGSELEGIQARALGQEANVGWRYEGSRNSCSTASHGSRSSSRVGTLEFSDDIAERLNVSLHAM